MRRTRGFILAILLAAILLLVPAPNSIAGPRSANEGTTTSVRIPGHRLPALSRATPVPLGPGDTERQITLTIILRRDDQTGFDRYLREAYDPHSKIYRHFMTQDQIANRFGPSERDFRSIVEYLRDHGLRIIAGSKNRLTLVTRGTRAQIEHAFDVRIRNYRLGNASFYANDRDPALPANLERIAQAIQGLSDFARPRPVILPAIGSLLCSSTLALNPYGGLFPLLSPFVGTKKASEVSCEVAESELKQYIKCLTSAGLSQYAAADDANVRVLDDIYHEFCVPHTLPFLSEARPRTASSTTTTLDGTGQKIGLLEFDTFNQGDVANYLGLINYPSSVINNLSEMKVNGGAPLGAYEDEVLLDIDSVLSIAPGAKVVVYDSPFSGPGNSF